MHKLDLPVNCDAALSAARDYFERVTREYHTKGPDGRDRSQVQTGGCRHCFVCPRLMSEPIHFMHIGMFAAS